MSIRTWRVSSTVFLLAFTGFAAETNDSPALLPRYAELPPTFWERHSLSLMAVAGGLIVAGGVLTWLLTRPKPVVVLPPEIVAQRALDALETRVEDGPLLSEVSQVLHRYFISVFALPPGEFTTGEFTALLGRSDAIGAELAKVTMDFLQTCDECKFAAMAMRPPWKVVVRARELIAMAESRRPNRESPQVQA